LLTPWASAIFAQYVYGTRGGGLLG